MKDLEKRSDVLFESARRVYAADPGLLDRVFLRLQARRQKPRILVVALALATVLFAVARIFPIPERTDPVREVIVTLESPTTVAPRAAPVRRLKPPAIPLPVVRGEPAPVEEGPPEISVVVVERKASKRPYQPRAIVEFLQIDWKELEAHDELPVYVRSIIGRRDSTALLAALDRLDLEPDLKVVRGELRAGASRCKDAVRDFDAILDDTGAEDLHGRAERGRVRCR